MIRILALSAVFAVGLSSPTFAQTGPDTPADPASQVIDETMILEMSSLEDRAAMLRRCAGPPPKAIIAADKPKQTPVPAPVSVAERVEPAINSGG